MKNRLETMPLSQFIKLYNGDLDVVDGDVNLASEITSEYISIVGGSSLTHKIMRRNEKLNLTCYLNSVFACETLLALGCFKDVCDVLKELGYSAKESDTEGLKRRVSSLKASFKLKLERLNAMKEEEEEGFDPEHFPKEIASVCTYYRMTIDKDKLSAKEYAYIVKTMSKEIKDIKNQQYKKK